MQVKDLIEKLEEFDGSEEIKLRVRYLKGKADDFFDFTVRENAYKWDKSEPNVIIESEVDIDDFLTEKHGCYEYRNY
jgi:hypothetical protein